MADIFASTQAKAKDGEAWWREEQAMPSTHAWWRGEPDPNADKSETRSQMPATHAWWRGEPAPEEDGSEKFTFEAGLDQALTDYERAAARLRAIGVDPDTIDGRDAEPWYMGGIRTLTGLGIALDWLDFGWLRSIAGGVTGLMQGKGLDYFLMEGDEVDEFAAGTDYKDLLGKGPDWHIPSGKELLLMWGADKSKDREGKVDAIDLLGLGLEIGMSPSTWFSLGTSSAVRAAVSGGTKAVRATADDIMEELAQSLSKLDLESYADDIARASELGDPNHIRSLIQKVVSPTRTPEEIASGASPSFARMAERVAAFDELEKYGLLDNLPLGSGKNALQEYHIARSGLLPSAEELAYMTNATEYTTEVKNVMKSLGNVTSDTYKANEAFAELSRRAAETQFGDYGGLKLGLPFHQLSPTGKYSFSVISQRQIDEIASRVGIDRTFVEAWKRSVPGRAMFRTFVSDWRIKQLEAVDPTLASQLLSLKRMSQARANSEMHVSIDALVNALKPLRKADRIDLLKLVEAPGEVSAVIRQAIDDTGLTAFREISRRVEEFKPGALTAAIGGRKDVTSLLDDVRKELGDDAARLLDGALSEAAESDGARFAYQFWAEYDKMDETLKSFSRKRAARELGFDSVPERYETDPVTGKRTISKAWSQVETERSRIELLHPDVLGDFLVEADTPTLHKWNALLKGMTEAHANYSMYRVPGRIDMSGITKNDMARAAKIFAQQSEDLEPHQIADIVDALVTEITSMRRSYEDAVRQLSAVIREDFGLAEDAPIDDLIESFRTGEYVALKTAGKEVPDDVRASAEAYYRLSHAGRMANDKLDELRRRMNGATFELLSVQQMTQRLPKKQAAQARALIRQKLASTRKMLDARVPTGVRVVSPGIGELEDLVARNALLPDIARAVDDDTLAFFASRNGAVDDAARVFGSATDMLRKEIDEDVERLLTMDDHLVWNGKSQIRGVFHLEADDLDALHQMPVLTGKTDDLGIPALKLFSDPSEIGGSAVRVSVNVRKVAFVNAGDLQNVTGLRQRIPVLGPSGKREQIRLIDLVDRGYDAIYVRGGDTAPKLYMLPEPDDFHSAMRGVYEQWGLTGLPRGARALSAQPSSRPIITSWRDKTGKVQFHTFAGDEASALRKGYPSKLKQRVKDKLSEIYPDVEQQTRVRMEDADAYIGSARVLEFDPDVPRSYSAGVATVKDIAAYDPAVFERAAALASEHMTDDIALIDSKLGGLPELERVPVDERGLFHVTTAGRVLESEPLLTANQVAKKSGRRVEGLGASTGNTISLTYSEQRAYKIQDGLRDAIHGARLTMDPTSGSVEDYLGEVWAKYADYLDDLLVEVDDEIMSESEFTPSLYKLRRLFGEEGARVLLDADDADLADSAEMLFIAQWRDDPYMGFKQLDEVLDPEPVVYTADADVLARLDPDNVRVYRTAVDLASVKQWGPDLYEVQTHTGGARVTLANFTDFSLRSDTHAEYRAALVDRFGEDAVYDAERFGKLEVLYDPDKRVGIAVKKIRATKPATPDRMVEDVIGSEIEVPGRPGISDFSPPELTQRAAGSGKVLVSATMPDGKKRDLFKLTKTDTGMSVNFLPNDVVRDYDSYEKAIKAVKAWQRYQADEWYRAEYKDLFEQVPSTIKKIESGATKLVPGQPPVPGHYRLMYPINDSGYKGASLHAFLQAIGPRAREGADISIRLSRSAEDLRKLLVSIGFDVTSESDKGTLLMLSHDRWAAFLERNPKALTHGIVSDVFDGMGLSRARYAVPLDELPASDRAAAQARINLAIAASDADARMYKAFKTAEFDEISTAWTEPSGMRPWETLSPSAQQAVRDLYSGDSPYDVLPRFTNDEAAVIQEWADTTRIIGDALHAERFGKPLASENAGFTAEVVDAYRAGSAYASEVDVLSDDFLLSDGAFKTVEAIAYTFTPKDMSPDQRKRMARLMAITDHYYNELERRGIAASGGKEAFKAERVHNVVKLGDGREIAVAPGIAQEAVDRFNEILGAPGAVTRFSKMYGVDPSDMGTFMMRAWETSKSFYSALDDFADMTDERRLTALQKFIVDKMGLDPAVTRHINPMDFLLPAYEYAPHIKADFSDIPWWRRTLGLFEQTHPDDMVNRTVYWHPVTTKMENVHFARSFNGTIEAVNKVAGRELMQTDPAKAYAVYIQRAIKSITNYDMLMNLAQMTDSRGLRVVRPAIWDAAKEEWTAPAGYRVFQLPDMTRLGRDAERMHTLWPELGDEIDALLGRHGSVGLMARTEIVDDFEKATRRFFGDEQFAENMRVFDQVQGIWKTYATVLRPGFHVRNGLSNLVMNLYAGVKNVRHYREAFDIQMLGHQIDAFMVDSLMGDNPRLITSAVEAYGTMVDEGLIQAKSYNIGGMEISAGRLYQMLKEHGILGTGRVGSDIHIFTEQELMRLRPANRMLNPFSSAWGPTTAGRAVGETVEHNARVAHFLAMFEATGDPSAAAWSVRKYLFDYDELTDTEREVFRRVIPFYAWLRKNFELTADMMMHRPFLISAGVRTQTTLTDIDLTEYKPEWVEETGGFALPGMTLGGINKIVNKLTFGKMSLPEDDERPVYVTIGVPYLDLLNYNGRDLLSSLSPLIRAPVEIVTNYNTYYGKPISDFPGDLAKAPTLLVNTDEAIRTYASEETQAAWDAMLQEWGVARSEFNGDLMTNAWFTYIWRQASPHLEAWGKALPNSDPDFLVDFINFWTGVKLTPIDEASAGYYTEQARVEALENKIRAVKQHGVDVPTWTELNEAAEAKEDEDWWR
jgi:hypothetical protein